MSEPFDLAAYKKDMARARDIGFVYSEIRSFILSVVTD